MFHIMRNTSSRGTPAERAAAKAVGQRLPLGWSAGLRSSRAGGLALEILASDGRDAQLALRSYRRLSPRDVANVVRPSIDSPEHLLVVAPFLGPRSRELLTDAGVSYVDATGNLRVTISDPAVFLEGRGDDRDPNRQPRALRSLKGAATGRVVRALCDFFPPYGVRTLAEISSTPLGTVSRVVSLLEEEALLTRDGSKQVDAVDWPALIRRWARDYGVRTSNRLLSYLEPRGLSALPPKLSTLERYCVTGSMASAHLAPTRLATIYVDDADAAGNTLGLVPTEAGANVWLLEPYDEVVFDRTQAPPFGAGAPQTLVVAAAPSQVAADLLTSPGRGPREAEALIERMRENEKAWRHDPRP